MTVERDDIVRITEAPTIPFEPSRHVAPVPELVRRIDGYDKLMDELKEKAARLTLADRAQLIIDDMKLYAALTPHLLSIIYGRVMKNWKTTLSGVVGALAVLVQSIFGVVIPQEAIIAITLFVVGLFAEDSKK